MIAEWETLEISGVQNPELADIVGKTVAMTPGDYRKRVAGGDA